MGDLNQRAPAKRTDLLRWLAGLPCLLASAAVAVAFAVSWQHLPDPMAVQFAGNGHVNRVASPGQLLATSQLSLVCTGLGSTQAAVRGTLSLRSIYTGSLAIAIFLGYLFTVLVWVNSDAETAKEVRMPMWHLGVAGTLAVVVGLVVRVLSAKGVPWRRKDERSSVLQDVARPSP
ncbi:hypothetical protein AB0M05_28070 [Streptomyces violaceusniger]|uniref:hypothetical protein n=1 Tax=Streptomyces violaceusniger TaxID=68280 RepID=UPI00342F9B9B